MHTVSPPHLQMKNNVFSQQSIESMDVKLVDTEGDCIYWGEKFTYNWTYIIQTCVVQESTVYQLSVATLLFLTSYNL